MTTDLVTLSGFLFAAFSLGFCSGYLMTRYKDAINNLS